MRVLAAAAFMVGLLAGPALADSPILLSEFTYQTAPYPQSHASTIAETKRGALVAVWFGGTNEQAPDVGIWFSRKVGDSWQTPVEVANGKQIDGPQLPTWNPVLFQQPGSDLFLFYKVGPSPETWWGMVMRSSDDGQTWGMPQRLPDGILGPIKNKPVILSDGSWLAGSSVESEAGWAVHFERSEDHGLTWKATAAVPSPLHLDAIQPSILFHKNGMLEAIVRTKQGVLGMTWSTDLGRTWGPLSAIDLPNPNSGTDAVTLADGRQLLVYNPTAHEAARFGKGMRYPLNVALSDDGVHWRPVLVLEDKPMPDGYAYPAVIQTRDGLVHVTYTWNRVKIRHVVIDPKKLK